MPGEATSVQKQRVLIERESARARAQMREIQEADVKTSGAQGSKEATAAARERKKAAMDNIQKFLGNPRSMNPQI